MGNWIVSAVCLGALSAPVGASTIDVEHDPEQRLREIAADALGKIGEGRDLGLGKAMAQGDDLQRRLVLTTWLAAGKVPTGSEEAVIAALDSFDKETRRLSALVVANMHEEARPA